MTAIMNKARRVVSALTLGTMLGGTALVAFSCVNPLQDELDKTKKELTDTQATLADAQATIADLNGQLDTKQAEIATLTAQKDTLAEAVAELEAAKTALQAQLADANTTHAEEKSAFQASVTQLEDTIATLTAQLEAKTQSLTDANSAIATLTAQKNDLIIERDALLAEKNDLIAENDLLTKQVSLMRAGGRYQEAAWFDQHKAIVDHAQEIGSQLATVFLGDSLINEAVGGKNEAEIKTIYPNISTPRIHVAAIDGATVEEIKWGIRNGWLPEKTAYTIVHAGRAEIEANIAQLVSNNQILSEETGQRIGSIYTALVNETTEQAGNPTSVIFSGVVKPTSGTASTIHNDNMDHINGANGIQSMITIDGDHK